MAGQRGKRIPDHTREVVIAALLTGQGITEVAQQYKLPKSSVSRIKKEIDVELLEQVGTKKNFDFNGAIIDFLKENLETLTAIARETRRPEYIKDQPASEVATLYGVIADKSFRIISALEPAEPNPADIRA